MSLDSDSEWIHTAGPGVPLPVKSELSSSTIVSEGGLSYVEVHNIPGCESANGRAHCLFVANRNNEATSSSLSFGCAKTFLTRSTRTKPVSIPPVRQLEPTMPFQPLPPLPHASSLQLPSFTTLSPGAPSTFASQPVPVQKPIDHHPQLGGTQEPVKNRFATGRASSKQFSLFIHPNSPYVPWSPEMRRKYVQSINNNMPDFSTRRYSDTNIQTFESGKQATHPFPDVEHKKKFRALERLGCLVGKNIKQAARRVYRLGKPLPTANVWDPASVDSLGSSDSNTLAIWLQNQRKIFKDTMAMSLDDYEQSDEGDDLESTPKNGTQSFAASFDKHVHSCSDSYLAGSVLGSRPECSCTGTLSKRNREMTPSTAPSAGLKRPEPHQYLSPFMDELVSSYQSPVPPTEDKDVESVSPLILAASNHKLVPLPTLLPNPIYDATEQWSWLSNLTIRKSAVYESNKLVSDGKDFHVNLASGTAGPRPIHYMAKSCTHPTSETWDGLAFELALFKRSLLPVQVAPTLLGMYREEGLKVLAMALPHKSFWMHASPEMPYPLKRLCIEAVKTLHRHRILHGDLRLSNVLIGGDAKVTIINYQNARIAYPETLPHIQQRLATPADFSLELRCFEWLLDYNGSRFREYSRLLELAEIPGEAISRHLALLHEKEWLLSLNPIDLKPRRFVVPGQSPEELAKEINGFIDQLIRLKQRERRPTTVFEPSTPTSTPSTSVLPEMPGMSPDQAGVESKQKIENPTHTSALVAGGTDRRKRRRVETPPLDHPHKKIRFSKSVDSDSDNENESENLSSQETHLVSYSTPEKAYETSLQKTKGMIVEANIRRCTDLGLPHPEAVRRDPVNPRWQDPDIIEYIERHNRLVQRRLYVLERGSQAGIFKFPQPRRSLGNIKRALRAIAHPKRMAVLVPTEDVEHTSTDERKKRKRTVGDDGPNQGDTSKRPSKVPKTSQCDSDGSPMKETRTPIRLRGILKNPRPKVATRNIFPFRFAFTSGFRGSPASETGNTDQYLHSNLEAPFAGWMTGYQPTSYLGMVAGWFGGVSRLLW